MLTFNHSFETQKKRMAEISFRRFGVDAIYKIKSSNINLWIRAIVKHDHENNPGVLLSGISEKITAIDFKYSDVSDPRVGDTVLISGEKYTIDEEINNDRITVRVSVT